MNPLISDLSIALGRREAEIELNARQRVALARAAAPAPSLPDRFAGIVAAIKRAIDPRGYALAQVEKRSAAPPATVAPGDNRPALTALAMPEITPGDRQQRQAA
jgi:hypothetical protein